MLKGTKVSAMLARAANAVVRRIGLQMVRIDPGAQTPPDFDSRTAATCAAVRLYTMTSPERVNGLVQAIRYVVANDIPGDIVECGVWRGGSMMAAARTLLEVGDDSRTLHLFDTFEGMPAPTKDDFDLRGQPAADLMRAADRQTGSVWALASLPDVQANLAIIGYPADRIRYVVGKVEDTVPASAPERIAILRLDTDWYESTAHELEHLVPRLSPKGVLIIDDYGHWQGARKAVDEFLASSGRPILLNRLDYSGRIAILP